MNYQVCFYLLWDYSSCVKVLSYPCLEGLAHSDNVLFIIGVSWFSLLFVEFHVVIGTNIISFIHITILFLLPPPPTESRVVLVLIWSSLSFVIRSCHLYLACMFLCNKNLWARFTFRVIFPQTFLKDIYIQQHRIHAIHAKGSRVSVHWITIT